MVDFAIEAEGLGKQYKLGRRQSYGALRDVIAQLPRRLSGKADPAANHAAMWALRNVSFTVPCGEVLGIIGRNGSGKSTLLKILSRITEPSAGLARVHGRIGALLEVGTGFHPELSGRENIFVNGAILGMTRNEIRRKFDEIVDFSGVEEFLDTPVKRYSSGMRVRLAFAVAAHLDPEILVVDEVLAVGDAVFQKKCLGRMQDVATEGRTVLIVSHQLEMIQSLCSRVIWLDRGGLVEDGAPAEVVAKYLNRVYEIAASSSISERHDRQGSGLVRLSGVALSQNGVSVEAGVTGQALDMHFDYHSNLDVIPSMMLLAEVRNEVGTQALGFFTHATGQDFVNAPGRGRITCHVPRMPLSPGRYTLSVTMRMGRELVDKIEDVAILELMPGDFFGSGYDGRRLGTVLCDHSWSL